MFKETPFYYHKKASTDPTEEEITTGQDDGWVIRKSKNARKKRRAAADDKTSENGSQGNKPAQKKKTKETGAEHKNGAQTKDETTKPKDKSNTAGKNKQKQKVQSKSTAATNEEQPVVDKSLVETLSRAFSAANQQQIEELIVDMKLTSFDQDNAQLRNRILNALIEKQQKLVKGPAESESENEESNANEEAHVDVPQFAEPTEETLDTTGITEKPPHEESHSGQANEEVDESVSVKPKKKRGNKKKSARNQNVDYETKESEQEKKTQQKSNLKKENGLEVEIDESSARVEETEMNLKELLLNELNSFEPSDPRSIELLMKWKREMESNWNEFAATFEELKGLELIVDKWVYCPNFRNIICDRQLIDLLLCLLPGGRIYHEFVVSELTEICRCLDALNIEKKKMMQDIISRHCKQLFHVLTVHDDFTNTGSKRSTSAHTNVHPIFLPKPSSFLPPADMKDPLRNKIRDLDACCENLDSVYRTLRQQRLQVEQMKPTSNENFRRVYNVIKNDVNGRMNGLQNERIKLQNDLQMVDHERKLLENTVNRAVNPMQSDVNKIATDIRAYTIQQKEYEKKLSEINSMLDQLNLKHRQLNDKIHEMKSQYAPKEEKLHSEHQTCSFRNVALEKEQKCYERIKELNDGSWRKLEEWSQDFMEKYRDESEVCENEFIDHCIKYVYLLLDSKAFLLNRVEHLKQMVSDARQYQMRTKQLYGDALRMKPLRLNADGEPHIALDTKALEWIEDQLKNTIVGCRDHVRKSSYQRFVSQLSTQLTSNGYDITFLKPFIDEVNKEVAYGGIHNVNSSGATPITTMPLGPSTTSNTSHLHPYVNTIHMGGNTNISGGASHPAATRIVPSYAPTIAATPTTLTTTAPIIASTAPTIPIATNPTLTSSNIVFPSMAVDLNVSNFKMNVSNPLVKPNVVPNSNVNVNPTLNFSSNVGAMTSRKPPMHVSGIQSDVTLQQTQQAPQIPVLSKKLGVVRDAPVIPKPPTVAKQTQTTNTINTTNNTTAPAPQNDASMAQRMRNSQRRPLLHTETHGQ